MSLAQVAWINPRQCIGCTRCIDACPFDAIVGVAQKNHLVLPDDCTECGLCLPACPVDCIEWHDDARHPPRDHTYRLRARDRAIARRRRLNAQESARTRQLDHLHEQFQQSDASSRARAIKDAVTRAQQRRPS